MKPKHFYKIEHGHLILDNRELFISDCKQYERAYITVQQDKPTRSSNQNRYYWSVVVKTLSEDLGYTPDEMHEVLKYKFLGYREIEFNGKNISTLNDTKSLKTNQFEEYLTNIRQWASADLNIMIALPNEVEY